MAEGKKNVAAADILFGNEPKNVPMAFAFRIQKYNNNNNKSRGLYYNATILKKDFHNEHSIHSNCWIYDVKDRAPPLTDDNSVLYPSFVCVSRRKRGGSGTLDLRPERKGFG